MILIKDGVKRELTDNVVIKMFLEAGWVEFKKPVVEKPEIKETKTEPKEVK